MKKGNKKQLQRKKRKFRRNKMDYYSEREFNTEKQVNFTHLFLNSFIELTEKYLATMMEFLAFPKYFFNCITKQEYGR